ncbi:phytoene/squalene synthase family protein [Paenibacillus methanolicus]|uniref:Phytoene synthase n=1 Tax=Paenibacillus methanolicus TaxID=582686 RepID=A0A5S5CI88_9BACL|nr:phytoene/squalene synthase family protein [Paenibacillus methanolicus]TYP79509.1 phytoene synthase [Paenibacillus methanolicus]
MEIAACLSSCEAAIAQGSKSFYNAFRHLPSPRREAVYVIYAFCRMIDDSIDEPWKSPYSLDELERHLKELHRASGHFIWPALRWLFAAFPLSKEPFYRQMEGQRLDLSLTHYSTMEELERYCYLVAGTVGEMLLPVLHDQPGPEVTAAGIYLGQAMQIVNIVRDIGEDMNRGRRYVPAALLAQHGYGEEEFKAKQINEAFRAIIRDLTALADRWFARGLAQLDGYPASSAFAIELAAAYYRGILDEVRVNRYQVFHRRAVVGPAAMLGMYARLKAKYAGIADRRDNDAVS